MFVDGVHSADTLLWDQSTDLTVNYFWLTTLLYRNRTEIAGILCFLAALYFKVGVGSYIWMASLKMNILSVWYDKKRRLDMMGSTPNKRDLFFKFFFLHLDNKICKSGHLCSTAVFHYDAVLSHIWSFIKTMGDCCDLDIAHSHITLLYFSYILMNYAIS